jgi:hypothetical protein
MSGIKTTMAAVIYRADHIAAATKAGQNVSGLHAAIQLRSTELLRDLNLLLSTMQTGDANIATIQAQITALS